MSLVELTELKSVAIAPWFVCDYHSAALGSNPMHTIDAFLNLCY